MGTINQAFEILQITRSNVIDVLVSLTNEQLCAIPKGFNNNVIWNAGHILVTQQSLTYRLSGNELKIPIELIDQYAKGTSGKVQLAPDEIETIKSLLSSTLSQLIDDYSSGLFQTYSPYLTSYGYKINTIEEAIQFNNTHEGLHLGYMMALRKSI